MSNEFSILEQKLNEAIKDVFYEKYDIIWIEWKTQKKVPLIGTWVIRIKNLSSWRLRVEGFPLERSR